MGIIYFHLDPLNTLAYVVSLQTNLDFIRGSVLDDKLVSGKKDTDLSVIFFSDPELGFRSFKQESILYFQDAPEMENNSKYLKQEGEEWEHIP